MKNLYFHYDGQSKCIPNFDKLVDRLRQNPDMNIPKDLPYHQETLHRMGYDLVEETAPPAPDSNSFVDPGSQFAYQVAWRVNQILADLAEADVVADFGLQALIIHGNTAFENEKNAQETAKALAESERQNRIQRFMLAANVLLPKALHSSHTFGGFSDQDDATTDPPEMPKYHNYTAWTDLRLPKAAPIRLWWYTTWAFEHVRMAPYTTLSNTDHTPLFTVIFYTPGSGQGPEPTPVTAWKTTDTLTKAIALAFEIGETYQAAAAATLANWQPCQDPDTTPALEKPGPAIYQQLVGLLGEIDLALINYDAQAYATALNAKATALLAMATLAPYSLE